MKKILLITILSLTMALACTACSKVLTPDTLRPDNNITSVTETPDDKTVQEKEDLPENDSDHKEQGDSSDDDSKNQEQEDSSNNNTNFQVLDELSDDLSSFQIQIDDVIYSIPMKYSDFIAHGFVIKDDDSEKIEPDHYTRSGFNRGDLEIRADIINADDNEQPISECYIGSIEIDKGFNDNGKGVFIALPKGIIFNKSTLDDVKAAYGEPSSLYEGSLYTILTYNFEPYQKIEIEVGAESGVVDCINVRNLIVK